jgi:adenosine deaminase CECR1
MESVWLIKGRFSLMKHPKLVEICREKGILIEVCPIS